MEHNSNGVFWSIPNNCVLASTRFQVSHHSLLICSLSGQYSRPASGVTIS
jgi:hypothetical protein